MGRWQLLQAILLFLGAPLWVGVFLFAALNAATGGGTAAPDGALLTLMLSTWAMLHAPKLSGYAEVLAQRAQQLVLKHIMGTVRTGLFAPVHGQVGQRFRAG